MDNHCQHGMDAGTFESCIYCQFLRVSCAGPRTTAMNLTEWIEWIRAVMARFGIKNRHISEYTYLSRSTVDDILLGRRKNIARETCCIIEDYVLGSGTQPCAMRILGDNKDVVYQDCPETLEALRKKDEELLGKDHLIAEAKAAHEAEAKEYQELVKRLYAQIDRKDNYIDRLAKRAGI